MLWNMSCLYLSEDTEPISVVSFVKYIKTYLAVGRYIQLMISLERWPQNKSYYRAVVAGIMCTFCFHGGHISMIEIFL